MSEIPSSLYYLIGSLIVANIGAIGSIALVAFKATWWISKLDARVDAARDVGIRAHKRIDALESK